MYAELERKCFTCSKLKPLSEFYKDSSQSRKRMFKCKPCSRAYGKLQRELHPEKYKLKDFKSDLKKNYGMTLDEYKALHKSQDGRCACCGIEGSKFKRGLNVDHDHKTSVIRGLLCNRCNPGIGYFEDSIENLHKAIKYLEKFKK